MNSAGFFAASRSGVIGGTPASDHPDRTSSAGAAKAPRPSRSENPLALPGRPPHEAGQPPTFGTRLWPRPAARRAETRPAGGEEPPGVGPGSASSAVPATDRHCCPSASRSRPLPATAWPSPLSSARAQIDGHGTLIVTNPFSSAAFPAECSRGCQPRVRPFADQVTFKLREHAEDMKHQLAARCGRIDGFGDALESDVFIGWAPTVLARWIAVVWPGSLSEGLK